MKYSGLLAVLILSACVNSEWRQQPSPSLPQPSPPPSATPHPIQSFIRTIDFNNFTYHWYPAWADAPASGKKIVLKDGAMNLDFDYGKEPREFFLVDAKYGDLTDDGNEEAVVVLGAITSGTARHSFVFVYTALENKPIRLWVHETGDRSHYGYYSSSIKDGHLLIEVYKPKMVEYQGQQYDLSKSDTLIRSYYKWDGTNFGKVKTEETPTSSADSSPWVLKEN